MKPRNSLPHLRLHASALAAFALAAFVPSRIALAQVTTVDEGSFTITRGADAIGREEFTIRSTPGAGGAVIVAQATVSYSERRLAPALSTSPAGAPLKYQIEITVGDETRERLSGQVGRGRFSARSQTPDGEAAREYVVADGALILEDDVFHQYFFLARGERTGAIPVVMPRRNRQLTMTLSDAGPESVAVGGRALAARRLVLQEPGGPDREVWADAQGRVLKVRIAAQNIVALRDEPPR